MFDIITSISHLFDIDSGSAEALAEYFERDAQDEGTDLYAWIYQEQSYVNEIVAQKIEDGVWTRTYAI
jgi:hypothetical protein